MKWYVWVILVPLLAVVYAVITMFLYAGFKERSVIGYAMVLGVLITTSSTFYQEGERLLAAGCFVCLALAYMFHRWPRTRAPFDRLEERLEQWAADRRSGIRRP